MVIRSLERALEVFGTPLYVLHEIVHNRHVVEGFRRRGVVFVDGVEEVPEGATLLYSAHGVSPQVREGANRRRLRTIDATCPLVTKVHLEAVRFARQGYRIVLIGHAGHDEIVGTLGEAPERMLLVETPEDVERLPLLENEPVAYLTQTTLSVDDANRVIAALRRRFPDIVGPPKEDICYATQNRQEAVQALAREGDLVLVIGSRNSSNSIRLTEVARACGTPSYLIDDVGEIDPAWFEGVETVILTAGASAPGELVWTCLEFLRERFGAEVQERNFRREEVQFPLPRELRQTAEG
jgi:4-hydroxy-3-methylbut-2-enyl diphosphate reductase